jgi:hypothetical protein
VACRLVAQPKFGSNYRIAADPLMGQSYFPQKVFEPLVVA